MHEVPLLRDADDGDLLDDILFEQHFDGLMCSFQRSPFADPDQQVVLTDDHHVTAFEGNLVVVSFPGQQEMVVGIRQFDDLVLVFFEQGMGEEDVFGQEGFAGAGFFGRLVKQDIVVDDDANVAGKDEIRDRVRTACCRRSWSR